MRYHADITAGSLKVPESRIIADLLLRDCDQEAWNVALYTNNLLQTRSPATAKRLACESAWNIDPLKVSTVPGEVQTLKRADLSRGT